MGAKKDLKKARALLTEHEKSWIRGAFGSTAMTDDGGLVGCYCAGGAIRKAATGTAFSNGLEEDPRAAKALKRFALTNPEIKAQVTKILEIGEPFREDEMYLTAIVRWNDMEWRKKDDVIAAFDAAIEGKK